YDALGAGGVYVCTTPHRYSGPHDVSKFFDDQASGFHLKEYTYHELRHMFRMTGFNATAACVGVKGRYFSLPDSAAVLAETALGRLPYSLRRLLCRSRPFRPLFGDITIVGRKLR